MTQGLHRTIPNFLKTAFLRMWNPSLEVMGLTKSGHTLQWAKIKKQGSHFSLSGLGEGKKELSRSTIQAGVNFLDKIGFNWSEQAHPLIITPIDAEEVLIRSLELPLTKSKEIDSALAFQAEPLFPYPLDSAVLTYYATKKSKETTALTVFGVQSSSIATHLASWNAEGIEPEQISCIQSGLLAFGTCALPHVENYLIAHLMLDPENLAHTITMILILEGRFAAAFTHVESDANRIYLAVARTGHGLLKEAKNAKLEGILATGLFANKSLDTEKLSATLNLPLLYLKSEMRPLEPLNKDCSLSKESISNSLMALSTKIKLNFSADSKTHLLTLQESSYSEEQLREFAVPIGLAYLGAQSEQKINFRQGTFVYPHSWKRFKWPLTFYFMAISSFSLALYLFGQCYLQLEENNMRTSYMALLAGTNKSHEQVEMAIAKMGGIKLSDPPLGIDKLGQEEILERISFLEKDLRQMPDSFPLYPQIPRVSDVLAWLADHPTVKGEDGAAKLQLEHFTYAVLRRPTEAKKQDTYQVKVELEFLSSTPKWAREFHDALIAPNEWVDARAEIKWNASRGQYKTAFYLKDRTFYPAKSAGKAAGEVG